MLGNLRSVRRKVLTPNIRETRFVNRGFHARDAVAQAQLEKIGGVFLAGFAEAARSGSGTAVERDLQSIERDHQGFAYEGAAMALAILDAVGPRRGHRIADLLAGAGDRHAYMVQVGIGWALARLPSPLHRRIRPADPLLRWLALDGYGFHQAYFHTGRYVTGQYRHRPAWPGDTAEPYAPHVVDQGIGRALWFVEGADPTRVAATIRRYDPSRHSDLFSGAGLAATYAGGVDRTELAAFLDAAGGYGPDVAQGAAFAAKARARADLVTEHTRTAVEVFCGTTVEQAAAVTDEALADLPDDGLEPAYAAWRRRIAHRFEPSRR